MTEQTTTSDPPATAVEAQPAEKKRDIRPIQPPPEPEYEFIDPAKARIFMDATGKLRTTIADDRSFLDVAVVRCFPQSIPDRFWALVDRTSRIIGVIADPVKLDAGSRDAMIEALTRHYFRPVITAIHSLKEEFGAVYFEVDTDRGPRAFVAKGVREGVDESEDGEVVLVDVNENRYSIPDWHALDLKSQRLLMRIL